MFKALPNEDWKVVYDPGAGLTELVLDIIDAAGKFAGWRVPATCPEAT